MVLRPFGLTASCAVIVLAVCPSPQGFAARAAPAPSAAAAEPTADLALSRRAAAFLRVVSFHDRDAMAIEYLDVQPGQAPGITTPTAVVHAALVEGALFKPASDIPRPEAAPLLNLLAQAMKQDAPGARLTLLCHTNEAGAEKSDDDLSLRRAKNLFRALIDRATDPGKLSAVVIGARQPMASNLMGPNRAFNRRVEFLISANLDANLAVIRLRPVNRAFFETRGSVPHDFNRQVQIVRPDLAGATHGASGAGPAISSRGTIELVAAADNPGPSPIPRKPIMRPGQSNWPDPAEDGD